MQILRTSPEHAIPSFGSIPDMQKRAFITGITGQDGSYLAELLLSKGYEVHGMIRRSSSFNTGRIMHIFQDPHAPDPDLILHYGDLTDASGLNQLLKNIRPDEIYHLGAQSHVRVSFDMPEYTANVTGLGTIRMLEAIRDSGIDAKFYNAASSEMFGEVCETPQKETTPFHPRSPYGAAKVFSYWTTVNFRESYGMFACNGILFNHESPRRGETFVTRKITRGISHILAGKQNKLFWEILMHGAIGGIRPNSWMQCGACCSKINPMITLLRRENRTRFGNFLMRRSNLSEFRTGNHISESILGTTGQRKSISFAAMREKQKKNSDGNQP